MYQNEILVRHEYNEVDTEQPQQESYVNVNALKITNTKVITEEPVEEVSEQYTVPPPARPKPKPEQMCYAQPPLPVPVFPVIDVVDEDEHGNSSVDRHSNSNSDSSRLNQNQNALKVPSASGGNKKNKKGDPDSHSIASGTSSARSSYGGGRGVGGSGRDIVIGLVVNLDSYLQNKELIFIMETFELDDQLLECSIRPRQYRISDSHGHRLFSAEELPPRGLSSWGCLQCCFGNRRSFEMTVSDKDGLEVLYLTKPGTCIFYCFCCLPCFCCCLQHQHVSIYSPADTLIGSVKQDWSLLSPKFSVYNSDGKLVLVIESQQWMTSGCFTLFCGGGGLNLKIYAWNERSGSKGEELGQIKTSWPELENKGGVDHGPTTRIGLKFPRDMDSTLKSILIGACIHLSFTYTKAI